MRKLKTREERRAMRHIRVRRHLSGSTAVPRLSVHKSSKNLVAQLIDDVSGSTLYGASTLTPAVRKMLAAAKVAKVGAAGVFGKYFGEQSLAKGIKKVVFDRGGHKFHGRLKAFADAAREAGLEF